MINVRIYYIHLRIQKIENLQNIEKKTCIKLFSCTSGQLTEQKLTLNQNEVFIIHAKILKKTYNNSEQTRDKIPKPDKNLPYNLKKIKNLNYEVTFLQLIVLAVLIPVILMNIENVAQWVERFSLKHNCTQLNIKL